MNIKFKINSLVCSDHFTGDLLEFEDLSLSLDDSVTKVSLCSALTLARDQTFNLLGLCIDCIGIKKNVWRTPRAAPSDLPSAVSVPEALGPGWQHVESRGHTVCC